MPHPTTGANAPNRPEKVIGPYAGGVSVAVWLNTIQTDDGTKPVRSVTISPRRYRDRSGQWKDSTSYRPGDLPALLFALAKAQEFIYETPLPGDEEAADGEAAF